LKTPAPAPCAVPVTEILPVPFADRLEALERKIAEPVPGLSAARLMLPAPVVVSVPPKLIAPLLAIEMLPPGDALMALIPSNGVVLFRLMLPEVESVALKDDTWFEPPSPMPVEAAAARIFAATVPLVCVIWPLVAVRFTLPPVLTAPAFSVTLPAAITTRLPPATSPFGAPMRAPPLPAFRTMLPPP